MQCSRVKCQLMSCIMLFLFDYLDYVENQVLTLFILIYYGQYLLLTFSSGDFNIHFLFIIVLYLNYLTLYYP